MTWLCEATDINTLIFLRVKNINGFGERSYQLVGEGRTGELTQPLVSLRNHSTNFLMPASIGVAGL